MNEQERLKEQERYRAAKTKCDIALDECGIGHDLQQHLRFGANAIAQLTALLVRRCSHQLHQELLVNVPTGISPRRFDPDVVLRRALPGVVGEFLKWDTTDAIDFAADVAEDVNAHDVAGKIREMATVPV